MWHRIREAANFRGRCFAAALAFAALQSCEPPTPARVLVFSKTAGYRHESIEAGKAALMRLGAANGFIVDTTEDAARITEDSLRNYAAVVFLSTTGNILSRAAEVDLQRFVQAGGGFVGIHAASDASDGKRSYESENASTTPRSRSMITSIRS